ncbi:condensation domain-containing protein, partial [Flavobacterium sp. H122]|uniref:condensation domain-containing protein n=1 Tax=Flavobacterium sp. H122 TaxID=2529860 RepID=UPI0020BF0CBB
MEGGSLAYNMTGALILKGDLDKDSFATAFAVFIAKHEIMRTCFKMDDQSGELRQYTLSPAEAQFELT